MLFKPLIYKILAIRYNFLYFNKTTMDNMFVFFFYIDRTIDNTYISYFEKAI